MLKNRQQKNTVNNTKKEDRMKERDSKRAQVDKTQNNDKINDNRATAKHEKKMD